MKFQLFCTHHLRLGERSSKAHSPDKWLYTDIEDGFEVKYVKLKCHRFKKDCIHKFK